MRRNAFQKLLFTLLLLLLGGVEPVFADEEPLESIGILTPSGKTEDSGYRFTRPASQIAENVTVITANDIKLLNARTVDEVLQTVPGIQLYQVRTPGSTVFYAINGSLSNNVLLLLDGVPQNLLGVSNNGELGMIPVQRIERIEIIKGAASVAWGAALGGVVNVITREPDIADKATGIASASYGRGTTSDLRGGVSGTIDRLGYYMDGGVFHSNGLLFDNRVTLNHFFGKLTYTLPGKGRLTFATDFREGDRVEGFLDRALNQGDTLVTSASRYASSYLKLEYPLLERLDLELLTSAGQKDVGLNYDNILPAPFKVFDGRDHSNSNQASARLTWGDHENNIVTGFEFLHDDIRISEPVTGFPFYNFSRDMDRYGAYLNGSYTYGHLTLLPGIRFDEIAAYKRVVSYNMGATWNFTRGTLLRGYAAKGYSLPFPNYVNGIQNIDTVQAGIESSEVPSIWLKVTIFYNYIWNIETWVVPPDYPSSPLTLAESKQFAKGFEFEGRTVPWHGLALGVAFSYSDVRDKDTGSRITLLPISTTKLSLKYSSETSGFQGILFGNFVDWPSNAGNSVHDGQIVWDIHLSQKLSHYGNLAPELFFSGHNLLNNVQNIDNYRPNAPRWLECGLRVRF